MVVDLATTFGSLDFRLESGWSLGARDQGFQSRYCGNLVDLPGYKTASLTCCLRRKVGPGQNCGPYYMPWLSSWPKSQAAAWLPTALIEVVGPKNGDEVEMTSWRSNKILEIFCLSAVESNLG